MKILLFLIFVVALNIGATRGDCQIKELINKDLRCIDYVPYNDCLYLGRGPLRKEKRKNRKFRRSSQPYNEIIKLDILAIPYLVEAMTDTTATGIELPCEKIKLKVGDVAFAVLYDILPVPWHDAFGGQWDVIDDDGMPLGIWTSLQHSRIELQSQLKKYLSSSKGKMWVRIFKNKMSKKDRQQLLDEYFKMQ